ncbi:MAG: DUF4286 family protein [Muribaculaceae bacterium]|nr:DUF4286 family protein [Muribaculaceae bacterium]MDE6643467.1 DUF4286 family protein [Muribaculaceae bacterium]
MKRYILNTSFHMEASITDAFLEWVKNDYIKVALSCSCFTNPIVARILTETEPGVVGYAVHLETDDLEAATDWHDREASGLKAVLSRRFGQRIVFFSTFMEVVE